MFAHEGAEGALGGFAVRDESGVNVSHSSGQAGGGDGGHVERGADGGVAGFAHGRARAHGAARFVAAG